MEETILAKNIGLRGVKVADTRISDVNGEKGVLIYRGYNIADLAPPPLMKKSLFTSQ